jgi:hypothetical protein
MAINILRNYIFDLQIAELPLVPDITVYHTDNEHTVLAETNTSYVR